MNLIFFIRICKRQLKKLLKLFILIFVIIIVFICYHLIGGIHNDLSCTKMIDNAKQTICKSYFDHHFIGSLCRSLCQDQVKLIGCPNIDSHNGKDYVLLGQTMDQQRIVIKSRSLTVQELIGNEIQWFKHKDKKMILDAIKDIIKMRFFPERSDDDDDQSFGVDDEDNEDGNGNGEDKEVNDEGNQEDNQVNHNQGVNLVNGQVQGEDNKAFRFAETKKVVPLENQHQQIQSYILNLIPWQHQHHDLNSLNETELINLYLLLQDNEYVLSRLHESLFPGIRSTCGHYYAVDYIDNLLDYRYFIMELPWKKSLVQRIDVGIQMMIYLREFQMISPKVELCDVKFEHFGLPTHGNGTSSSGSSLLMIDSDMIYPEEAVKRSIESIQSCQHDDDCDFIDCKGKCKFNSRNSKVKGKCKVDSKDDDLKRLCRNIFFMGKYFLGIFNLGMFSDLKNTKFHDEVNSIYNLCFNRNEIFNDIKMIEEILVQMKKAVS